MKELTESDMAAIDAAVKVLSHTTFSKDPVLKWVRSIEPLMMSSHVCHIRVIFWAFRSSDLKIRATAVLQKKDESIGWEPGALMLKIYSSTPELWLFNKDGTVTKSEE